MGTWRFGGIFPSQLPPSFVLGFSPLKRCGTRGRHMRRLALLLVLLLFGGTVAAEQFKPTHVAPSKQRAATAATPKPAAKKAATAAKPAPKGPPAKMLFGGADTPAPLAARAIGSYSKGCLSGGVSLPIDGPDWQVMRLSRNRNWGHPRLHRIYGAPSQGRPPGRLAWPPRRRLVAAARRTDGHRPYQPSSRPRRRHLADANAGPHAFAAGARGRHSRCRC